MLTGKEFLLLFLYLPGHAGKEGIEGITRLTKAIFIFEKEFKHSFKKEIVNFPEFVPWNFGPWSKDLLESIDFFRSINFILVNPSVESQEDAESYRVEAGEFEKWQELGSDFPAEDPIEYQQRIFTLTELGKCYVEKEILPTISQEQRQFLQQFKEKITSLSLYTILRYVYTKYEREGWTRRSLISSKFKK